MVASLLVFVLILTDLVGFISIEIRKKKFVYWWLVDAHWVNYYPNQRFRKRMKAHNCRLFACTCKRVFVSLLLWYMDEEGQECDQHVETESGFITVVFASLSNVNWLCCVACLYLHRSSFEPQALCQRKRLPHVMTCRPIIHDMLLSSLSLPSLSQPGAFRGWSASWNAIFNSNVHRLIVISHAVTIFFFRNTIKNKYVGKVPMLDLLFTELLPFQTCVIL